MDFSFLVHPMSFEDVLKKFPFLGGDRREWIAKKAMKRLLPDKQTNLCLTKNNPSLVYSKTGKHVNGEFRATLLLPEFFNGEKSIKDDELVKRIIAACDATKEKGVKIIGLGAFNAVVGNGGKKIAAGTNVAVTTGNTYTTALAIEGTLLAAKKMGIETRTATLAVVGATGSIGRPCVEILAPSFGQVNLVGRDESTLQGISEKTPGSSVFTNLVDGLSDADVIITVTSADTVIIEPEFIKSGAVVCDVARPRDVAAKVSKVRDDILVIDGGIVQLPEGSRLNTPIGLPEGLCEGCMGETFLLALEKMYVCYTLGKNGPTSVTTAKVLEMTGLAQKHGFQLAGLRRDEALITDTEIELIKLNAQRKKVTTR